MSRRWVQLFFKYANMLVDYFLSPQAKLMLRWILSPHLIKSRHFVSSTSRISPTRLLPVRECLGNSPSCNKTNDMPFVGIDHPRLLLLYPLRYFTRYSVNSSTTARITNPQQRGPTRCNTHTQPP